MKKIVSLDAMIMLLKTMAETSRLRVLVLLCHENLTISDFTFILGQSQSRVLWHLRLLYEARLIECYQMGDRIYFKLCHDCWGKNIVMAALSALSKHDVKLVHDLARLVEVKKQRRKKGKKYFLKNKAQWDEFRFSHIADHVVESALLEIVGDKPFDTMLGIGIDPDPILKLFSSLYTRAFEVLLDSDVLHLSIRDTTFDLVILHGALHFLENPEMALNEVARVLRPHGRLLIVDFVRYAPESSYSYHADLHLGFSDSQIEQWLKDVGLILEQTVCLAPMQNENNERLMVTLWLARDSRLLVDDIKDKELEFA
ncbi:ArsR family transcriptional regulator [Bartonella taylorii]|uniref:ArsR family transcriptional regulator n=1 Tax=Bartonella taylorii TaxID=33046 RepID=UPI001ABB6290|nr:ArsR family transcriptional regulator [Bartonella taylorii]